MPPSAKQKFSAHRHDVKKNEKGEVVPLDIWAGVQHTTNIDKRIRDLGHDFLEVKNLFGLLFLVQWFEVRDLKNSEDMVTRKPLKRRLFFLNRAKASCYNTHEAVNFIDYPDFPYYREYPKKFSNENSGLIPKE
jgi:hypothetical protein